MFTEPVLPRPYADDVDADVDWAQLPVCHYDPRHLTPTQEGLSLTDLVHQLNGGQPEGDDPLVHVIRFEVSCPTCGGDGLVNDPSTIGHGFDCEDCDGQGTVTRLYIHDGHHRWAIAAASGSHLACRVWAPNDRVEPGT